MAEPDQILLKLLNDQSFVLWINGKANHQERLGWERWEQESPLHAGLKRKAGLLYKLPLELNDGADVEEQLTRLHKRVNDNEKVFRFRSRSKRKRIEYYMAVAAAVALLLMMVGMLSFYYKGQPEKNVSQPLYTTIEVDYGERGSLKISDGSSIRLNANSSLRYSPEQFNTSKVEVWLEGEAYFSISRNPGNRERTFIVHTPDCEVWVLGTRFNINTRFRRTGVVLEEGSIEVVLKDSLKRVAGQRLLEPGQRALLFSRESHIEVQQVDTLLYTAWLDGKLVFENAPLTEVIQNIEDTYGVYIEVAEPELFNEKISGSFRNPDLKTLIKGLEEVFNLDIQQKTEDKYLISKQ